jgi:hypothetical protein
VLDVFLCCIFCPTSTTYIFSFYFFHQFVVWSPRTSTCTGWWHNCPEATRWRARTRPRARHRAHSEVGLLKGFTA